MWDMACNSDLHNKFYDQDSSPEAKLDKVSPFIKNLKTAVSNLIKAFNKIWLLIIWLIIILDCNQGVKIIIKVKDFRD